MEKQRIVPFIVLIVLGSGLLVYGLQSRIAVGSAGEQGQISSASELAAKADVVPAGATQEVATAAAVQETPGQAPKTDVEAKKAPAACPT